MSEVNRIISQLSASQINYNDLHGVVLTPLDHSIMYFPSEEIVSFPQRCNQNLQESLSSGPFQVKVEPS